MSLLVKEEDIVELFYLEARSYYDAPETMLHSKSIPELVKRMNDIIREYNSDAEDDFKYHLYKKDTMFEIDDDITYLPGDHDRYILKSGKFLQLSFYNGEKLLIDLSMHNIKL